ncbi:hypothetical protein H4CHR_01552 [Variovorax sp. PBS-H4]|nr:hypothetical protein H4CHR_01552 [Variovorax sp. PBS-H4]
MKDALETVASYALAVAIAGGLVLCMLQPFGAIW